MQKTLLCPLTIMSQSSFQLTRSLKPYPIPYNYMPLAFSFRYEELGEIDIVKKILDCLALILLPCSLSLSSSGHLPPNSHLNLICQREIFKTYLVIVEYIFEKGSKAFGLHSIPGFHFPFSIAQLPASSRSMSSGPSDHEQETRVAFCSPAALKRK